VLVKVAHHFNIPVAEVQTLAVRLIQEFLGRDNNAIPKPTGNPAKHLHHTEDGSVFYFGHCSEMKFELQLSAQLSAHHPPAILMFYVHDNDRVYWQLRVLEVLQGSK
jgi:hypothetical protein